MPRTPKHLPYVRLTTQGRLQYYRRVRPDQRHLFDGKGAFTVLLECDASKPTSKAAQAAWKRANELYETHLKAGAESKDLPALRPTPLAPRDAAGVAAEPLRKLLKAVETGQLPDGTEKLLTSVLQLAAYGIQRASNATNESGLLEARQAQRVITELMTGDTLRDLHVKPDEAAMAIIQKRLFGYMAALGEDLEKRAEGDYSTSKVESIAPPLPKSQVTYEDLREQWLIEAGGLRTENGSGVSTDRVAFYKAISGELIQVTGQHFPAQLTVADARKYLNWVQEQKLVVETKQKRLGVLKNLFAVGVRNGLLKENPFANLVIKKPKNAKSGGYRTYSREELLLIYRKLNTVNDQTRAMIAKTLIATGARSADVSMLRHKDVKQTESGVWYFNFVDEPLDEFPHQLKGGPSDERQTPIHPWLIKQGVLDFHIPGKAGYMFGGQRTELVSQWFQNILISLKLYESRVTTLHSLRHTFIDLMREARLPQDVARAMVGHSARDVHDKTYGEGLQKMPDVLHKELIKLDLDFLDNLSDEM